MICRYKIKFISDIEQKIRKLLVNIAVAPFVGVWIEIRDDQEKLNRTTQSLPSWECGLKFIYDDTWGWVWRVAPFVGVWIEILLTAYQTALNQSLPSWECGLKSMKRSQLY